MALGIRRFTVGLQLVGQSTVAPDIAGELRYNSATDRLQLFDTALENITTDAGAATLTNKTLTTPVITSITSGTGTFTLNTSGVITIPSVTDTLIGQATTNTLTNKSISGSTNTFSNIPDAALSVVYIKADGTRALTGNWAAGAFTITANGIQLGSAANTITGLATIINSGTLTLPTATTTLVGTGTTDTLSNKTFSDAITMAQIVTPSTPASGFDKFYVKSNDIPYILTAGGIEKPVDTGVIVENAQSGTTYTFAMTDIGKLVSFSNSSPITATVPLNSSVAYPIGSTIQVIATGSSLVISPAGGVTIDSLNGLTLLAGKYAQATLIKTGTDTWYLFGSLATSFINATGGTITTDGNYRVHTFLSSGTFTITSGLETVASLVIAGGGGSVQSNNSGGGGAGGLIYTTPGATLGIGSYTVTIGAGAPAAGGGNTVGNNGSNSVFNTITATGGGGGGASEHNNGAAGGSGGGAGYGATGGAASPAGQGFAGGNETADGVHECGGGGGGAGGVGGLGSGSSGGTGGIGLSNSITGSAVFYASGGGGGAQGTGGTASAGGGGAGVSSGTGNNGAANTGGGAGGNSSGGSGGGVGGSGIVIIRYQFQ